MGVCNGHAPLDTPIEILTFTCSFDIRVSFGAFAIRIPIKFKFFLWFTCLLYIFLYMFL